MKVVGCPVPTAERRFGLLDAVLNTGVVNPRGSSVPLGQNPEFDGASPTPGCVDYDTVKLDCKYQGQHPHCNQRSLSRQDR